MKKLFFRNMRSPLIFLAMLWMAVPTSAQVRQYGPLKLDFRQARKMDRSIVIPAKNPRGQILFVGIFCEKRLFNFTGASQQWKEWNQPETIHELKIVNDVCNSI